VTGYIGFKTLTIALERGYRVRAVVRSGKNINDLKHKSTKIAQSAEQGQLQFAVIPDFLEADAFFMSLDGISVVIHLASPLALEVMHFPNCWVSAASDLSFNRPMITTQELSDQLFQWSQLSWKRLLEFHQSVALF
jgi:hypothetical protein